MLLLLFSQEWFAVYVELNQQIAALLSAGDEEDLLELKALQQQLSDVCYRQASQLESRQNVLQSAHEFHGTAQDVSLTAAKHSPVTPAERTKPTCLKLETMSVVSGRSVFIFRR